jgi:hypothetical protein
MIICKSSPQKKKPKTVIIYINLFQSLLIEIGRLPNMLELALRLEHDAAIPIRPCHNGKVFVLNSLVLQPLVMH